MRYNNSLSACSALAVVTLAGSANADMTAANFAVGSWSGSTSAIVSGSNATDWAYNVSQTGSTVTQSAAGWASMQVTSWAETAALAFPTNNIDWTDGRMSSQTTTSASFGSGALNILSSASATFGGDGANYARAGSLVSLTYNAAGSIDLSGLSGISTVGLGSNVVELLIAVTDGDSNTVSYSASFGSGQQSNLSIDFATALADGDLQSINLSAVTKLDISFRFGAEWPLDYRTGIVGASGDYSLQQVSLIGVSVPAPGAAALVGLAGLVGGRRRKA